MDKDKRCNLCFMVAIPGTIDPISLYRSITGTNDIGQLIVISNKPNQAASANPFSIISTPTYPAIWTGACYNLQLTVLKTGENQLNPGSNQDDIYKCFIPKEGAEFIEPGSFVIFRRDDLLKKGVISRIYYRLMPILSLEIKLKENVPVDENLVDGLLIPPPPPHPIPWIPLTIEFTLSDINSPNYYYYGGTQSNQQWKINRYNKNTLVKESATINNNSSYTDLNAAWGDRFSLVYGGV